MVVVNYKKEVKVMKSVVLLYNTCCIYEIVILNYFLKYSGKNVEFVSIDGNAITSMEGYSINVSGIMTNTNTKNIELMIIPGGNIKEIDNKIVWEYIKQIHSDNALIAGICAGVDVLDHSGVLDGIDSTHSTELDVVVTDKIITSRANGYVNFAIEIAKKMNLFKDDADLKETIAFWRDYKRMQ